LTGGVWWSWTLTLGAIVWAMLCGLALTLLAGGRVEPASSPPEGNAAFTTRPLSL
jgi:hypothetical protein